MVADCLMLFGTNPFPGSACAHFCKYTFSRRFRSVEQNLKWHIPKLSSVNKSRNEAEARIQNWLFSWITTHRISNMRQSLRGVGHVFTVYTCNQVGSMGFNLLKGSTTADMGK